MSEEELIATRTQLALDQWPHLTAAWGCVNCELLFKAPTSSGHCPGCNSESVFDVAAALAVERVPASEVVERAKGMIEMIDEATEGEATEEVTGAAI